LNSLQQAILVEPEEQKQRFVPEDWCEFKKQN